MILEKSEVAMIYLVIFIVFYFTYDVLVFRKSDYSYESGIGYLKMRFNTGLYGEYLTFNMLNKIDGYSKILVNTYIPKGNGETTELDLVYIHEKGIFVIESKNYGGWIYGDEKNYKWTQVFKNGKKFKFYNPIKQNITHIKHLKNCLDELYVHNYFSLIVFSKRCTLKKIKYTQDNLKVLKRT